MLNRRTILASLGTLSLSPRALAQSKTTRLVVSFTPGGPVDSVARTIAEAFGRELGRTVIVDNKPGANGAIGALDVARSTPDGGTLWITSVGAVAINPSLYDKLGYDMARDFAPVSVVVNNVELLAANPANPAGDAAAFVAAAKTRKEPTTLASSGIGSIPHLAMEQLASATGANFLHVPYKGAAPAITDLMGGQVDGFFGDVTGLLSSVRAGRLKPLGLASIRRHPSLPDVRTLEEQGVPGVDTNNWYAIFAPAKTPPATLQALNAALRRALDDPTLRDKLLQTGSEPAPSTPEELTALLQQDTEKWAKLIREKTIKAE